MSRDQRTRLNAELSHQYGETGAAVAPGRSSLTEELVEKQDDEEIDGELEQEELAAAEHEEPEHDIEPRKSVFELPRREPSRPVININPGSDDS